eukprot:CAMPEP_0116569458 /NCGR_PEP_ID=MMETSP0397-20121206/16320_1 /TAXON_ID=216820 /ORGANISM="Cyclophora tenuis, Strain ECT3854" /LENGTH=155 /DNA_ID=CAMNT_0004097055 /DNA_START=500 /DNA_END=964 /DNA_ORIENTATION=-
MPTMFPSLDALSADQLAVWLSNNPIVIAPQEIEYFQREIQSLVRLANPSPPRYNFIPRNKNKPFTIPLSDSNNNNNNINNNNTEEEGEEFSVILELDGDELSMTFHSTSTDNTQQLVNIAMDLDSSNNGHQFPDLIDIEVLPDVQSCDLSVQLSI